MLPIRMFFVLGSILVRCLAIAQAVETPTYPVPILVQTSQAPVTIRWPDGREARFVQQKTAQVAIRAPFTITALTCSGTAPARCQFLDTYQIIREKLVWYAHPDRSKIGQLVQIVNRNGSDQTIFQTYSAYQNESTFDSVSRYGSERNPIIYRIPPLGITCDHFDFLPQAPRGQVHFQTISIQRMSPNSDTGINENQLSTVFENAVFRFDSAGVLRLTRTDVNPRGYARTFLDSNDGIHFFDVKKGNDACQFGTNADLSTLTRQANQLLRSLDTAPPTALKTIDSSTLKNIMEYALTIKTYENVPGQSEQKMTQTGKEVQ